MPTETKTKHTPRPWFQDSGDGLTVQCGDPKDPEIIAQFDVDDIMAIPSFEQKAANAKLAAAAPELLEALEGMFEAHTTYSDEFNAGGKIRAVCDWGFFNEKLMAAKRKKK